MSRAEPPHCQDALRWLKHRGWKLGALTGQDYSVLVAVAHCWKLWGRSDEDGERAAIDAVAALLDGCQEVCWPMARELIAHALDWNYRDLLWPKVVRRFEERKPRFDEGKAMRIARCHVGVAQVQT